MSVATSIMGLLKAVGTDNSPTYLKTSLAAALDKLDGHAHGGSTDGTPAKAVTATGRIQGKQGADVVSANNLTVGTDGNAFTITGTTQINLIDTTGWQNGSVISLYFPSGLTVKNSIANSGAFHSILLASGADFVAAANATLTLALINGSWLEVGRRA